MQRKILFVMRQAPSKEWKIPSLSGKMVSDAEYHHGETSAHDAVTGMAACYPTSNNLALLRGHGGTGSRFGKKVTDKPLVMKNPGQGFKVGEDAASARYVSVSLQRAVPLLFRKEDDVVTEHIVIDGKKAEPLSFCPVLPLAIINGCRAGIACGHSCGFPGRDPLAVLAAVRARLGGRPFERLPPAYCG